MLNTADFVARNPPVESVEAEDEDCVASASGYADGSTEHLRRTHVDLQRKAALCALVEARQRAAAWLQRDDAAVRELRDHRRELAAAMIPIDPIRRKYWMSLAALR
jgi:hypothetical protein